MNFLNNKMDLQKQAPVASFISNLKYRNSVMLVTEMIKQAIQADKAITRDDIKHLYWIFKSANNTKPVFIDVIEGGPQGGRWIVKEVDEQEFVDYFRTKENSHNWFKNNLGAAVIYGKLLVLPVIQIDEPMPKLLK